MVLLKVWRMRSESRVGRRRKVFVLRRGTSSGRPSRRRAVRHNTHRDRRKAVRRDPGRRGASGLALGDTTEHASYLYAREWRTSTTAHLPAPQAYMVDTPPPSAWPHTTHRSQPVTRLRQRVSGTQHDIPPGRPPPAPGFIVRIRSLSASQALR